MRLKARGSRLSPYRRSILPVLLLEFHVPSNRVRAAGQVMNISTYVSVWTSILKTRRYTRSYFGEDSGLLVSARVS